MSDSRYSDNELSKRDIPSFIEPRPPLISNPFMRPRPQKGTNLLELFEEDSECDEPELVQVYLRVKPCNKSSNLYEIRSDRCLITSLDTTTAGHGRRTQHNVSKMYTFSHIFGPESNQKEIFESVVKDNLKKLPEGHSFTLLTYGASGSGKTYTLMGTVSSPGIVPRSLEYLFKLVDAAQLPEFKPAERGADRLNYAEQNYELQWVKRLRQISAPLRDKYRRMSAQLFGDLTSSNMDLSNRSRYYVWVSFIEIYNEAIYDLLAPGDRKNSAKLAIREDSGGNVYVKGATQTFVKSGEEAYDVMVAGKHNLQVAATGIHAQSSRSHCIFTITMLTETEEGVRTSHVRLCDLAGCERAARTRNTGARMHESRAINSSLHVLERCLRVLRRRARAPVLVPYRESKLTRLLGAGLSGSRGEAVSMVVTLNPAPEYANETRHVLQLAAVAKDIQINNTISEYPSSLESSTTQDTTIMSSFELMKLRADNERLHFELVQAQSRIKAMQACMDEKLASMADTMKEVVEEAKAITKEYYETQIQALNDKMEEMIEEYESRLNTPSRNMEVNDYRMVTEIAILEEKYTAEKLARARLEEEIHHLRACIEERDEKSDEDQVNEDVVVLSDSENSDEEDPCNESLEPTFKKEDINRSRMIRQSAINDEHSFHSEHSDTSMLNKTSGTLKDEDNDNDCTFETGNDVTVNNDSFNDNKQEDNAVDANIDAGDDLGFKKDVKLSRETYFVESKPCVNESLGSEKKKVSSLSRATYCVSSEKDDASDVNDVSKENRYSLKSNMSDGSLGKDDNNKPATFINSIISSIKESTQSNNSLALFEKLEEASKVDAGTNSNDTNFFNIKILKEKRNFFDREVLPQSPETPATVVKCNKKSYFDNINNSDNNDKCNNNDVDKAKIDDYRSPSIVKDDVSNDFEPSMIKKLLGQSITKQADSFNIEKVKITNKKHDSIDLFEGLDSPQVCKNEEVVVDNVRKSIQSTALSKEEEVISNNISVDVYKETKTNVELNSVDKVEENQNKEQIIDENITDNLDNTNKITEVPIEKSNDIENVKNNESQSQVNNTKTDNTLDDFENIYKDITAPRATEFDLLVSQEIKDSTMDNTNETENEDLKYNLRQKSKMDKPKNETRRGKKVSESSPPKGEKSKPKKRNLRLRRRQNASEDNSDVDKDGSKDTDVETTIEKNTETVKFKDIINLQKEFSDVTLDKPAPVKEFKDIPSPEKNNEEYENHPPALGIQSCPAKSITRSRRKLFTPRPEPLEESMEQTGGSNERLYVPRPSYHKLRVRRKL